MLFKLFVKTVVFLLLAGASFAGTSNREPQTVSMVDLNKYAGTWYEIARYPNGFQKKCIGNVTATYSLLKDGKVSVLNQCLQENGKTRAAKGKAKVADTASNAKLRVTFFWPFYGDYWILDLDPEYGFAVVGEPERKYLWILSRTPEVHPDVYSGILSRLQEQGYDTAKLVWTKQGI